MSRTLIGPIRKPDLEAAIRNQFAIINTINDCHACLFNCDESIDLIKQMNVIADIISFDNKLRWWNQYDED